jgi:predicted Fe-Mo cluster-binding NifX family protein
MKCMKICVPVAPDGRVDPRWGRASRVAVADVSDGTIRDWAEFDVNWDTLHDEGSEGAHHARIARFLREHEVSVIAVDHVGPGMQRMLATMGIAIVPAGSPDAREAVAAVG